MQQQGNLIYVNTEALNNLGGACQRNGINLLNPNVMQMQNGGYQQSGFNPMLGTYNYQGNGQVQQGGCNQWGNQLQQQSNFNYMAGMGNQNQGQDWQGNNQGQQVNCNQWGNQLQQQSNFNYMAGMGNQNQGQGFQGSNQGQQVSYNQGPYQPQQQSNFNHMAGMAGQNQGYQGSNQGQQVSCNQGAYQPQQQSKFNHMAGTAGQNQGYQGSNQGQQVSRNQGAYQPQQQSKFNHMAGMGGQNQGYQGSNQGRPVSYNQRENRGYKELKDKNYVCYVVSGNELNNGIKIIFRLNGEKLGKPRYLLYDHTKSEIDSNMNFIEEINSENLIEIAGLPKEEYHKVNALINCENQAIYNLENSSIEDNYKLIYDIAKEVEKNKKNSVNEFINFVYKNKGKFNDKDRFNKLVEKMHGLGVITGEDSKKIKEMYENEGKDKYLELENKYEIENRLKVKFKGNRYVIIPDVMYLFSAKACDFMCEYGKSFLNEGKCYEKLYNQAIEYIEETKKIIDKVYSLESDFTSFKVRDVNDVKGVMSLDDFGRTFLMFGDFKCNLSDIRLWDIYTFKTKVFSSNSPFWLSPEQVAIQYGKGCVVVDKSKETKKQDNNDKVPAETKKYRYDSPVFEGSSGKFMMMYPPTTSPQGKDS